MTTNNELSEKIEKLTNEYNFKQLVSEKLEGLKALAYINPDKRVVCTCATKFEFQRVLSEFPATETNIVIGTATDKFYKDLPVSFRIDINNPCKPSTHRNFSIKIKYISGDVHVTCEMPISEVIEYVSRSERAISDSEHHYFIGVPRNRLVGMKVLAYNFKGPQITWYGGGRTLVDTSSIESIISKLSDKE